MQLTLTDKPSANWDIFVSECPQATLYHRSYWALLAEAVFHQRAHFLQASSADGRILGVLPLVVQNGLFFGRFMTSVPYFNYGGALGINDGVIFALMGYARKIAQDLRCDYLELRDTHRREGNWMVRTHKVGMELDLPGQPDLLIKQLGPKLRSQIKRPERESMTIRVGGPELLSAFYDVFCRNLRDLGTPVYPLKFFEAVLAAPCSEQLLIVIFRAGVPAAAAFLIMTSERAEIPWAACRSDAKPLGFNMRLYVEALTVAIDRGCQVFDFGRSTANSGTYNFKKQWGARPIQLHWHRWEKAARALDANPSDVAHGMRGVAASVWRRLPLLVTNTLGPLISPRLPW